MTSGRKDCMGGVLKCAPKGPNARREALYCTGSHARMTRTEIAETMGINPATLTKWLDPNGDERIPDERLEHLLQLADDNSAYLTYLASLQGMVVYDPKTANADVARLLSEFGDLLKAIDRRGDGTSVDDADLIEREGNQLIVAVRRQIEDARNAVAGPRAVAR